MIVDSEIITWKELSLQYSIWWVNNTNWCLSQTVCPGKLFETARTILFKNGLQNLLCGFFLCATEKKGIKKIDGEKELIRSLRVPMHVWFAILHRRTSKNFGNSFCSKSCLMRCSFPSCHGTGKCIQKYCLFLALRQVCKSCLGSEMVWNWYSWFFHPGLPSQTCQRLYFFWCFPVFCICLSAIAPQLLNLNWNYLKPCFEIFFRLNKFLHLLLFAKKAKVAVAYWVPWGSIAYQFKFLDSALFLCPSSVTTFSTMNNGPQKKCVVNRVTQDQVSARLANQLSR